MGVGEVEGGTLGVRDLLVGRRSRVGGEEERGEEGNEGNTYKPSPHPPRTRKRRPIIPKQRRTGYEIGERTREEEEAG